jgi:hypothetical protein
LYFVSFYSEGRPFDDGSDLVEVVEKVRQKLAENFSDMFFYNKRQLKALPNSIEICNSFEHELPMNPNANHFGYFDFKPFIINHKLAELPENAHVLYHDANFIRNSQYWKSNWKEIHRILQWLLKLNNSSFWVQFEGQESLVKHHVNDFTLEAFFNYEEIQIIKECHLINAARVFLKNNETSRNFVGEYLAYCKNKSLYITSSIRGGESDFKWSCGDQDILNCIIYRWILDGKLDKTFPKYTFLYRVIRVENNPFYWPETGSKSLHSTGMRRIRNRLLENYMKDKEKMACLANLKPSKNKEA